MTPPLAIACPRRMRPRLALLLVLLCPSMALAQLSQLPPVGSRSSLASRLGAVEMWVAGELLPLYPQVPCLGLGREQTLEVGFDLLGEGMPPALGYRIQQYDAMWQATSQPTSAYFSGFAQSLVDPPEASAGTVRPYVHYRLQFPPAGTSIKQSGNYQLEIYALDQPDSLLLALPFLVSEPSRLQAKGELTPKAWMSPYAELQQVDLHLTLPPGEGLSPSQLQIFVLQNARWDQAVLLARPSYATLEELRYEGASGARFEGGNSYRRLEHLRDGELRQGTAKILITSSGGQLEVEPATTAQRSYRKELSFQGIARYRALESEDDPATGGEYDQVTFRLVAPRFSEGEVYLSGDAFRYLPEQARRMSYDSPSASYVKHLLIKRGYQEYQYLYRPTGATALVSSPLVGSYWLTENYYTLLVYQRSPARGYDRLLLCEAL